ncbi:hypothetical protein QZN12_27710 [Burkholderia multivorans]|nr:hypothetical protein [Burkholderia multivorans]
MPHDNVLTAEARATIMDACQSISRSADALKECHTVDGDWGDDGDAKAFYDAELRLLERLTALLATQQPEPHDTHGWLRDGSLLFRLTDERHPQNRDEINVTMADGSRSNAAREKRAQLLLAILTGQPRDEVTPLRVERHSDMSVVVVFSSCRQASVFEKEILARTGAAS